MALCVAAACSSDTGPLTAGPAPLSGAPQAPAEPGGAPSPTSAAPDRDPCATETNFLTLVCATDADCAPAGYCEPYAASDAGVQQAPELAAATGPAGSSPSCAAAAAASLAPASGPAPDPEAADGAAPEGDQNSASADAGAWRPIGRCIAF